MPRPWVEEYPLGSLHLLDIVQPCIYTFAGPKLTRVSSLRPPTSVQIRGCNVTCVVECKHKLWYNGTQGKVMSQEPLNVTR
jgi:hypothetical protein